jgi:hypothetical protein
LEPSNGLREFSEKILRSQEIQPVILATGCKKSGEKHRTYDTHPDSTLPIMAARPRARWIGRSAGRCQKTDAPQALT